MLEMPVWRHQRLANIRSWPRAGSRSEEHVALVMRRASASSTYRARIPTFFRINSSAMAWQIPTPSNGEVPLPSSSMRISESEVASPASTGELRITQKHRRAPRIIAVDDISFAKVLRFFSISSSLDSRVRSESCMLKIQITIWPTKPGRKTDRKLPYSAGTKHPHMAMTVSNPICRKYVLFPVTLS